MRAVLAFLILSLSVPVSPRFADAGHPHSVARAGARAGDTLTYRTEDVRYPSGELTLGALLMLPEAGGDRSLPAAVIIQGSGASDRSNVWSRLVAEELVAEGVAVLLTDKRGTGKSEGDWRLAGFEDRASDALAGVEYLTGRPEVDPGRVGLVGLSQGGWVAPLAAARSKRVDFVVVVSGASVSFTEQSFHEMAATARQSGLSGEQVEAVLELNRAAGEFVATGEWEPYAEMRRDGMASSWGAIAEGFPGERDQPIWTFIRKNADFDPIPYWMLLTEPVLVLYGEEDEADNVPVEESVHRLEFAFGVAGKTNYRIHVVPGAGHGFLDMERHGLMEDFTRTLRDWIRETVQR